MLTHCGCAYNLPPPTLTRATPPPPNTPPHPEVREARIAVRANGWCTRSPLSLSLFLSIRGRGGAVLCGDAGPVDATCGHAATWLPAEGDVHATFLVIPSLPSLSFSVSFEFWRLLQSGLQSGVEPLGCHLAGETGRSGPSFSSIADFFSPLPPRIDSPFGIMTTGQDESSVRVALR